MNHQILRVRSLRTCQNNELNPLKDKYMHLDAMSYDWVKKAKPAVHQGQVLKGLLTVTYVRLCELIELTNSYFSKTDLFFIDRLK